MTPFKQTTLTVYRRTEASTNWGDATYAALSPTLKGTVYPLSVDERIKAGQENKAAKEVVIIYDTAANIREHDELYYYGEYHYITGIEKHRSGFLNHLEVYTTDSQRTPT